MPRLISVGYEGRSVADLIDSLMAAKVDVVIDVRLTPLSRKPGFSKRQLEEQLANAGIRYEHEQALGNPKENRSGFREGTRLARETYRRRLRSAEDSLTRIAERLNSETVAILCFEKATDTCHRQAVTDALLLREPAVQVLTV